ncbi:hypothetical protein F2Q68_00031119 [Brassica cretica]|uniref:Replication protein A OB domain-containing protein n=1 Tax=Brassica cretica TaxID=69181 RepID=A0A8S9G9Y4_BRACR|nr:hypothetical protein F2Q68_00031119 [Brassica cretica]
MVLADQWGNKIHATSKRSLMQWIQRVFPIDSWGVIEHVTVTPAGEIENGTKKPAFLIDVIGRIHELGDVQTVQVSGEDRKRVQFRLVDAEGNNLACCLWGTYAEQLEPFSGKDQTIICLIRFAKIKEFGGEMQITNAFDASRLFLNAMIPEVTHLTERLSNDDLSVALVQKPSGKKDGSVGKSIVAVDAEELWDGSYEEIEDPEILPEPILSLVGKSFCFGISITSDNVTNGSDTFVVLEVCSGDEVLTIETDSQSNSDMVTTSSTMSSGSVRELQITNAFDASRLFLNAMIPEVTHLTERLSNDDLSVALVQKPSLYNLNDAEIKTISEAAEATQISLCFVVNIVVLISIRLDPSSVGKSIVAVDAEELWDGSYEEIEDPEILPEPILSLVGKSFCFGISITLDNVTNGSDTFVVLEVCSGDKILTIETGSQSNSDMVTTSSTMSSRSAMMLDQISSDECPTPITKRKEDDYDLQDLTSSSKKQCIKIIKQEKTKND